MRSSSFTCRWLNLLFVLYLLCVATTLVAQPRPRPGSVPVAPPKAPAPVAPQPATTPGQTTPAPATPVPAKTAAGSATTTPATTTPPAATPPPTKADSGFGYRDQLIITRVTVTPAYGQGGAKPLPLKAGTVLQVKEERVVENELYLQTLGGVLRVKDVILLNKAYETLSQELKLAEKITNQSPAICTCVVSYFTSKVHLIVRLTNSLKPWPRKPNLANCCSSLVPSLASKPVSMPML